MDKGKGRADAPSLDRRSTLNLDRQATAAAKRTAHARADYGTRDSTAAASTPTAPPQQPRPRTRARARGRNTSYKLQLLELDKRQFAGAGVGNVADGYPACNDVGNNVLSCFPTRDTVLVQDDWSKFVWNANYPTFIGRGYVDIYLYSADSEQQLASWKNISNARGSIGVEPNDAWLPEQTSWTAGRNITHSYYFIIATSGTDVTGAEPHQATFEMVQTAPPATLSSALASESSAASSISSESASLSSLLSSLSAAGLTIDPSNTAALSSLAAISSSLASASASRNAGRTQNGGSGETSIPNWAIALIAVFGFLALLAGLILLWLLLRHWRRRHDEEAAGRRTVADDAEQEGDPARMSSSPGGESTAALLAGGAGAAGSKSSRGFDPEKSWDPDMTVNSSELERPRRGLSQKPSMGSLNPGDAALISNAFREMLRKPDFPKEASGDSKDQITGTGEKPQPSPDSLGVGTTTPQAFAEYGERESDSGAPEVGELIGKDVTVRKVDSRRPDIVHD